MDECDGEGGVGVLFRVHLHELEDGGERGGTDVQIFAYGLEVFERGVFRWAVEDDHHGVEEHAVL